MAPGMARAGLDRRTSEENPRCFFDVRICDKPAGQLVFELRRDVCAKTCENFLKLCSGECGLSKSGFELSYRGCVFHRIIPDPLCQSGDFTCKDGTGGESIFGPDGFEDESFSLRHVGRGVLSMANDGPDSNRSMFFLTFAKMPQLDDSHVVFGYVIEGMPILRQIEECGSASGRPTKEVVISYSGVLEYGGA